MTVLGIDPGMTGGLALIEMDGSIDSVKTMPVRDGFLDLELILAFIKDWKREHRDLCVFMEKAQAMRAMKKKDDPRPEVPMGAASMFSYGEKFGALRGLLFGAGLQVELVHPRTWMADIHAGLVLEKEKWKDRTAKERSLEMAQRLFPGRNWLATSRSKKPHSGMYDAALIAEYGRRVLRRSA